MLIRVKAAAALGDIVFEADMTDENYDEQSQTMYRDYIRRGKLIARLQTRLIREEIISTNQAASSIMLIEPVDVADDALRGGEK